MNFDIVPLFPTPLYVADLGRPLTDDERSFIMAQRKDCMQNASNWSSNNQKILNAPELIALNQTITQHLHNYYHAVYMPTEPLHPYVTHSCVNFNEKGHIHHGHRHPNSFASGVLYIDVDDDNDGIVFQSDQFDMVTIDNILQPNGYNMKDYLHRVRNNMIVIFPSVLVHGVDPNERDEERVSLAFNSWFSGTVGRYDYGDSLSL